MRSFDAAEIAGRMGAENHAEGATITGFATDSRQAQPGDLYLAIRGERVDGHDFVAQAFAAGAAAALAERAVEGPHLLVADVVEALAAFGLSLRQQFSGPVIGLTGSAGKTTTKEMLAGALSPLGAVVRTPGNREYGVHESAAVGGGWAQDEGGGGGDGDAGLRANRPSRAGRAAHPRTRYERRLQPSAPGRQPDGHRSREGGTSGGTTPGWDVRPARRRRLPAPPAGDRGRKSRADVRLRGRGRLPYRRLPRLRARQRPRRGVLPGRGLVAGSSCRRTTSGDQPRRRRFSPHRSSAFPPPMPAKGIERSELPPMRMERRDVGGATILLDAYNAAPPSVLAAIETLIETPIEGRRVAVLGAMRELGAATEEAHRAVGAAASRLDDVIFVGETADLMREAAGKGTVGDLGAVRVFLSALRPGDVVLVKGSRALGLERALD